ARRRPRRGPAAVLPARPPAPPADRRLAAALRAGVGGAVRGHGRRARRPQAQGAGLMAVSTGTAKVTLPTETQILITRDFDAPARLVYAAYTTPEHVMRWFAGRNGSVRSAEIDLRVGGTWRYVMAVASGGFDIAFHGEYRELVPDELIVTTEVFEGMPD